MKVKVFYDEDGVERAVCFTRSQVEAASDTFFTPGARYTVRDEERDGPDPMADDESDDALSTRHYPSLEGEDYGQ